MCSIYNLYIPTHTILLYTAYKQYSFNNLYQPLYIHVQYPYYTNYLRILLYTVRFAPYAPIPQRTYTHFYLLYVYAQKIMCSIYNLCIPTYMILLCTAYKGHSFNYLRQPLYIHVQYPYNAIYTLIQYNNLTIHPYPYVHLSTAT